MESLMSARPRNEHLHTLNRVFWIGLFLTVSAAFAWLEWRQNSAPGIGWFLAASLWSAVCGIGYSACDWGLRGGFVSRTAQDQTGVEEPNERR